MHGTGRLADRRSGLPERGQPQGTSALREDRDSPFVAQARRLSFHLDEIKEVVQIKRSGRCPCPHVLDLVRQKVEELDHTLADLTEVRRGLQELLRSSSRSARRGKAAVCRHIERLELVKGRR